jgi:GT2 family glycosyltransferase
MFSERVDMKCAIIILNWNGLGDTVECIDSIISHNSKMIDIFVVDNASEMDELTKLKQMYGDKIFKYMQNETNLGFSGGNNVAIDHAISMNYKYICTLNNDTAVTDNWIEEVLLTLDADHSLGSAGGKLMIYGEENTLNSTGIIPLPQGAGIDRGRFTLDDGRFDACTDVFGITAGYCVYRSEALKQVGLFDEDFFAYNEDVDLAWRLQLHGWGSRYVPQCVVFHKFSSTTGRRNPFKIINGERNRIYTGWKNFSMVENLRGGAWGIYKKAFGLFLTLNNEGRGAYWTEGKRRRILWLFLIMTKGRVKSLRKFFSMRGKYHREKKKFTVRRKTILDSHLNSSVSELSRM